LLTGLAGSAAYAVLQTQDSLTGNTISTATANLQISTDGVNYSTTKAGFDFGNIVPGGPAVPVAGYSFYLKNGGGTPVGLKLAVSSVPSNPGNVDLSKVNVILTTVGSGTSPQSFPLQSLVGGSQAILPTALGAGDNQQYKLQASMAGDAVNGGAASIGNIDFTFTGTAQ
jgi:hypothetical protein